MQALGGIISQITGALGGPTGQGIGSLFGMGSNIFQQIMKWRAMSAAQKQQRQLQDLINNPSKLTARIVSAEQPLNQNLTRTVTDATLANLATRGLNPQTAPGVTQQAVAQGIAPYEQQNMQAAAQLIASTLGLPFESAMALANAWSGGGTDTSSIFQNLAAMQQTGPIGSVGGIPDPSLGTISSIPSVTGGTPAPDPTAPEISFPPASMPDMGTPEQPVQAPDFWNAAWQGAG